MSEIFEEASHRVISGDTIEKKNFTNKILEINLRSVKMKIAKIVETLKKYAF